jgi:hypothetical protein
MGVILLCMDVRPTAASRPKHEIEHIGRDSYVVRPLQKNTDLVLTGSGHFYRTHLATTAEKEASAVMPAEPAGVASLAEKSHVKANSTGAPGILKEGQATCSTEGMAKLKTMLSLVQIGEEKAEAPGAMDKQEAQEMMDLCKAIDGGEQGDFMCSLMTACSQWSRIGASAAETGISTKEAMAIGIYTAPDAYKKIWAAYSGASIGNNAQDAAMQQFLGILSNVLVSQSGKRKPTAVLYTGLDQGGLLGVYAPGRSVRLQLPVSTTTEKDVAAGFAIKSPSEPHILLEITNKPDKAVNIEQISCFPEEKEHLLGAGATFKVASNHEKFTYRGKTVVVVKGEIA